MRTRPLTGMLWVIALTALAASGCGEKKTPDTLVGPAPVQQPSAVPAPVQTDSAAPVQTAAAPESAAGQIRASAPADASGTPAEGDSTTPPQSPTPPVPAPSKPEAKPSAPAAPAAKPAPPLSKQPSAPPKPAAASEKKPAAATKPSAGPSGGAAAAASKPAAPAPASAQSRPAGTVVVGTIQIVSNVPDPSTVPYDTCVTFIKYRVSKVLSGSYDGDELLAVFWGMKAGKLQPAARFTSGQSHRLTIEPFENQKDLARVMQADDTNEYGLTPYWVISHSDE